MENSDALGRFRASRTGLLAACVLLGACGDGSDVAGPGVLSAFERSVLEEIAVERFQDLFWVADGTHGGSLPQLGFAYSLPGTDGGSLGSVTVDPDFGPGRGDPFCGATAVESVQHCLRTRKRADGDWDLEVYFTVPPDESPRARPELVYDGRGPVATVRHRPQPLRVWTVRMTSSTEPAAVSAPVDEGVTLTSSDGATWEIEVSGTLEADLSDTEEVEAGLSVGGVPACREVRIAFRAVRGGTSEGRVRCGDRVWADISFTAGQPLELVWRS